jgi:hypothetical protein
MKWQQVVTLLKKIQQIRFEIHVTSGSCYSKMKTSIWSTIHLGCKGVIVEYGV